MANSFDIASKIDDQEIDNAVNQAIRELTQRYDLKNTNSEINFDRISHKIFLTSSDDFKIKAVYEILKQKLVKRNISLKVLQPKEIESALGGTAKQEIDLQQGISKEKGKEIVKDIKNSKIKVQAQIQEDHVRVSAKKKDDLQAVIQMLREKDYGIHIQFINYR